MTNGIGVALALGLGLAALSVRVLFGDGDERPVRLRALGYTSLLVGAVALLFALSGCVGKPMPPCLSTPVPDRVKLQLFEDPKQVPFGDKGAIAFQLIVEPASLAAFFDYVSELAAIAEKAARCVQPPQPK